MKQWMLIGTVGLALVCVEVTAQEQAPRRSIESFKVARDVVIGRAGSAKRADILAQLRAGIARGEIDPRTMLLMLDDNGLPAPRRAMTMPRAVAPTEGVPTTPNIFFFDPFETYTLTNFTNPPASLFSIAGQVGPTGITYHTNNLEFGVADNTTMTEGDNDPLTPPVVLGGVGAPAAAVNQGLGFGIDNSPPFLAIARASGLDAPNPNFSSGLDYKFLIDLTLPGSTPDTHTRLKLDWYLTNKKTNQWWSPIGSFNGGRTFFGGQNIGGSIAFAADSGGFLTNYVTTGILADNPMVGGLFAPPRSPLAPFPVGEWFEMMVVIVSGPDGGIGHGVFLKTPESVTNGFLDPRMATGAIVPLDGEQAGWIDIYPGTADDPATLEHEGFGLAVNQFGQIASHAGILGLAHPIGSFLTNRIQIGMGLDDVNDPLFQPDDAFIDDMVLAATPLVRPSPIPDFIVPYTDDMELYFPGPAIQSDRIYSSYNLTAISTAQNSTPGGVQSHADTSPFTDGVFRIRAREAFPTFPRLAIGSVGTDGLPFTDDADGSEASLVVSAKVRVGVSTNTSRAVRVIDGAMTGNFVGSILLGATNPLNVPNAADGAIWIRQPNVGSNNIWGTPPGFDETKNRQDNLTQGNWIPASQWDTLNPPGGLTPGESDFNAQFTNIPTGVAVTLDAFMSIQVEVQPNPNQDETNPFDEGLMRVTIDGSVISNPARPDGLWLAGGFSADEVQFWSGNEKIGLGDTIHIDDVTLSGALRTASAGPVFTSPNLDGFELYNIGETINGQGDTPFLNIGSLADGFGGDNRRKLTISTKAPSALVPGVTMVCRYQVDDVKLGSGLLNVGDTVVMNFSELPQPFDALNVQNTDCPGLFGVSSGNSFPFVLRPFNAALDTAENQPRLELGNWTLLSVQPNAFTKFPEPYNPVANPTDIELFSYSTTNDRRWIGSGPESLIINDPTGTGNGQVLQLKSTASVDGTLNQNKNADFFAASALLPQVNTAPGSIGVPSALASLSVDIFIESLDALGNPVNAAPRSRMAIPFAGAGTNPGRITTINFGGPNVNNNNLQLVFMPPPIIPDDEISYSVATGAGNLKTKFVSTGVSLVNGGLGLGPLVNTWFTVTLSVDLSSNWTASIDEDRAGPLPPVVIATGIARDLGMQGWGGAGTVTTKNLDFFEIRQGLDVGSGGDPISTNFRIRTLVNNAAVTNPQTDSADVTAPFNADKDADYCFYDIITGINGPIFQATLGPPNLRAQIAEEGAVDDVFDTHRDLRGGSILSIINRAYDSATNTVSGPLLFDPCPFNVTSPINTFDLYDGPTPANGILYTAGWALRGQIGLNNPPPAGGLGRIDGPAQTPPVSYNDWTAEPAGSPVTLGSRSILVCQWGSDAADTNNGVDALGTVFPRSRWFFDNVNLRATAGPTPCADLTPSDGSNAINASDLAFLLGNWGAVTPGNPADFNGDGVVNSSDLATLLGNWGPCP